MNNNISNINRRNFLRLSGVTGVGLVMGLSARANGVETVANLTDALESFELSPFVLIEATGKITIFNPGSNY